MDLSKTLLLFDVDGTLTKSRIPITKEMDEFMAQLRKKVTVGLVGGSDLPKIAEQMYSSGNADKSQQIAQLIQTYPYVFSENGLLAYENGKEIGRMSVLSEMGEQKTQRLINFCLGYMAKLELPVKRGNFIEFRTGLINVCPPGRSVTQEERLQFAAYDKEHQIREKFVAALNAEFGHEFGLSYAIGGQISIDCFPHGWDKTFCLRYVESKFDKIYFFGDRTAPGGNDHEIFADPRTIGHTVTDYDHTKQLVTELFFP